MTLNRLTTWRTCFVKSIVLSSLIIAISACGFSLRGSQALPDSLTHVLISAPLQYSPLSRALQQRLGVYQLIGIIDDGGENLDIDTLKTVNIKLEPEQFERRLLSVFTTGQVAEYELEFTVNYSVRFPNSEIMTNRFTVSREYQDDPDQILAKSRELDLILNELRREAADRIIRLLSSQYNTAVLSVSPSQTVTPTGN